MKTPAFFAGQRQPKPTTMTKDQILKRAFTAVKYLPCDRFTLLRIPKTGHTSMIKAFDLGQTTDPERINRPLIAVLRHPVDRLLSGFRQCIKANATDAKNVKELLDDIEYRGFFNEHIVPMWCFWDKRVEKVYYLNKITEFEKDYNITLPHLNKSKPYNDTISLSDHNRIKKIYLEDYGLCYNPLG